MKIRNYILYIAIIAAACIGIYAVGGHIVSLSSNSSAVKEKQLIILDPGHGGEDGGATGIDGTLEKDLNLQVSLKLRDILTVMGYEVIMTRESDISIHDEEADTTRERKHTDLINRAGMIEKNPDCLYIGIHMNKFPDGKYSGTQVFYSDNNKQSESLADSIQKSVVIKTQPKNTRAIKKATDDIYILKTAQAPAVMVECGFVSNEAELANLKNSDYQSTLAFAIAAGIMAN